MKCGKGLSAGVRATGHMLHRPIFAGCLLACCLFMLPFGAAASAQEEQRQIVKMSPDTAIDLVRHLLEAGQPEEAASLLRQLKEHGITTVDVRFLEGQVAALRGDWQTTARLYRAILEDHPGLTRVRLELARALFEQGDDEAAKYHFELALAAPDLPEAVKGNIQKFLDAIRARKRWTVTVSLGAAPDSNVNSATSAHSVTLYGLPFELSDDARRAAGVGLVGELGGSYRFNLAPTARLEVGGSAQRTAFLNSSDYDDTIFSGYAGPVVWFGRHALRLAATGGYRVFGGDGLYWSAGGRAVLSSRLGDRLQSQVFIDIQKYDYVSDDQRDGPVISGILQLSYAATSNSVVRAFGGLTVEDTSDHSFANTRYRLGGGYSRELPYGVTADISPEVSYRPFDEPSPLFGLRREDWSTQISLQITKRNLRILGLAPTIEYNYLRVASNIDLYSFDRHRINFGLTRVF